jgi:hypothetical protein
MPESPGPGPRAQPGSLMSVKPPAVSPTVRQGVTARARWSVTAAAAAAGPGRSRAQAARVASAHCSGRHCSGSIDLNPRATRVLELQLELSCWQHRPAGPGRDCGPGGSLTRTVPRWYQCRQCHWQCPSPTRYGDRDRHGDGRRPRRPEGAPRARARALHLASLKDGTL